MANTLTDAQVAAALQQQNSTLNDAQVAQALAQQQSPSPQQMQQQAASMPTGQVGQIPVTPGYGAGMNTPQSMQANSMLDSEAAKAKIAADVELQKNALDIQNKAGAAKAVKQAELQASMGGNGNVGEPELGAAGQLAKEQLSSKQALAKNAVTYNLLRGIGNDLMGYYDTAWKNKMAGSPQNEWAAQQLSGTVPEGHGLASLSIPGAARPLGDMMPKDAMSAVGKMQSASNELILRLQPFLSESLDKDGTNRILQSMLQMSKSEVPALGNERTAAIGKLIGTLRTVKRFTNASGDYTDLLNKMSTTGSDDDLNNTVQKVMSSPKAQLNDSDEKFFSNLEKQYQNSFTKMPGSDLRFQDSKGNSFDVPPERRYDALKLGWKEK